MDDRRYAVLSAQAVKMFAESVGIVELPDEIAELLSEDVSYRLRELIQHSCQFLRHCRRKKLTADDVNKALRNSDTPIIHGYGTHEVLPFRQTKEGDIYFVEDLDINLPNIACSSQMFPQVTPITLKAQWLAVEGVQKGGSISQGLQAKLSSKSFSGISEDLLLYYDNVTKAILGSDAELMKLALIDLRTNSKIAPLMPYFTNFFANGVRTVNYDVTQLTKLLHTASALTSNISLSLQPTPYLDLVVHGVLYCVIEPLAASINPLNDHWRLRDYASRLLAKLTRDWGTPLNKLRDQNIGALRDILSDLTRPFCSHYGAVMGLLAFGTQAIEDVVVPRLSDLCNHIDECMTDNSYANIPVKTDAQKVYGALLLAAEYLLRARVGEVLSLNTDTEPEDPSVGISQQDVTNTTFKSEITTGIGEATGPVTDNNDTKCSPDRKTDIHIPHRHLSELYAHLYECFGDALSIRNPVRHVENVYAIKTEEIKITLGADPDAQSSGEQLLKQLTASVNNMVDMPDLEDVEPTSNQTPDDLEYDLDEKSERSERSSRSSRSHSDENLSFLGEDSDLTVKTVSDPSQGIKLTIMKLPKVKIAHEEHEEGYEQPRHEEDEEEEDEDEPMPELEAKPEPVKMETSFNKCHPADIHQVFDITPLIQNDVFFVFRFLGCQQVYRAKRNSKRMSEDDLIHVSSGPPSHVQHLAKYLSTYRKHKQTRTSRRRCHTSGNIDFFL